MRKTKKAYKEFLDSCAPEYGSDEWIIGGVLRFYLMASGQYGKALQKHDPIAFQVGFNEWKQES